MPLPSKAASLPNRGLHRKLVTAGMAPAEGQSADAMTIRMIVSDLDGTLLLPDKSTSARTRRAWVAAARAAWSCSVVNCGIDTISPTFGGTQCAPTGRLVVGIVATQTPT